MSTPNPMEDAVSKLSERFGGEEETPNEEALAEEAEAVEESGLVEEELEAEEQEQEATEAEADDESVDEQDGLEEETPEEAEWASLAEVLEAGSIDPETLPVEITVAGEKREVTLKEALNGYQRQADYDRHMSSFKEAGKALNEERGKLQARYNELSESFALAEGYWDAEKKILKQRRDSIDWAKLRSDNAAEYAAAQAEFDQEERMIDEQQKTVREEFEKVKAKAVEDAQKAQAERAEQEAHKLLEAIPEWATDKAVFAKETEEVGEFLKKSGYLAEELQQFVDHRALVLARKAMLYDQAMAAGTQITRNPKNPKNRPKPKKLLRPGARPTQGKPSNSKKARELAAQAKKTGREDLATQRLLLKLGG